MRLWLSLFFLLGSCDRDVAGVLRLAVEGPPGSMTEAIDLELDVGDAMRKLSFSLPDQSAFELRPLKRCDVLFKERELGRGQAIVHVQTIDGIALTACKSFRLESGTVLELAMRLVPGLTSDCMDQGSDGGVAGSGGGDAGAGGPGGGGAGRSGSGGASGGGAGTGGGVAGSGGGVAGTGGGVAGSGGGIAGTGGGVAGTGGGVAGSGGIAGSGGGGSGGGGDGGMSGGGGSGGTPACGTGACMERDCGVVSNCDCGSCNSGVWCGSFCDQTACRDHYCCLPAGSRCDPSQDFLFHACCPGTYCLSGTCSN